MSLSNLLVTSLTITITPKVRLIKIRAMANLVLILSGLICIFTTAEDIIAEEENESTTTHPAWITLEEFSHTYYLQNITSMNTIPCHNRGIMLKKNSTYNCICYLGFRGVHCETQKNICDTYLIGQNNTLPCKNKREHCRSVPGGGFVCHSSLNDTRNQYKLNANVVEKCMETDYCPIGWDCINLRPYNGDYRCEPNHIDLRFRRSIKSFCSENLCQHGADCKGKTCVCLMHYTGTYCEKEIDYCTRSHCGANVSCTPYLGGYSCECPPSHLGIKCNVVNRLAITTLKHPNFIFNPKQYTNSPSNYCFYASPIGAMPRVTVDFGDETEQIVSKNDFSHFNNAKPHLLRLFNPPLKLIDNDLDAAFFQHNYKNPGSYNISVKATNRNYLTFNATYTVKVVGTNFCKLSARLKNCATPDGKATDYERKSHIIILSNVHVNCSNAKLSFEWIFHRVSEFSEIALPSNVYDEPLAEIVTNQPQLNIYPYHLPIGKYIIKLHVKMMEPDSNLESSALTRILIRESPIIINIAGGHLIRKRWNEPMILNASKSLNPNLAPDKQVPLSYLWTCTPVKQLQDAYQSTENTEDTYCPYPSDKYLLEDGPILTVPKKALLQNWCYDFTVTIHAPKGLAHANRFTDKVSTIVRVEITMDNSHVVSIKCLRNCDEDGINPDEVTAFEAICEDCENGFSDLGTFQWHANDMERGEKSTNIINIDHVIADHTDYGLDTPLLIIHEGVLEMNHKYIFVFSAMSNDELNGMDFGMLSRVEYVLTVGTPPEQGYCYVNPYQGYSLSTDFTIRCYNFTHKNMPLTYEIVQFTNLTNQIDTGDFISYDISPQIENIKLSPGQAEFDYVTKIRIIVTHSKGLYTFYDYNVTVFPPVFYMRDRSEVLNRLTRAVVGDESPLRKMRAAGNTFSTVEMIQNIAMTTLNFIQSDSMRYMDNDQIVDSMDFIRSTLVDHIAQLPMLDIHAIKHRATALDMILQLPKMSTDMEPAVSAYEILKEIIAAIEVLIVNHVPVLKLDILDLGPPILSIAANLLQMPVNYHNKVPPLFNNKNTGKDEKISNHEGQINIKNINQAETLHNYTRDILQDLVDYFQLVILYKVKQERSTQLFGHNDIDLLLQKVTPRVMSERILEIPNLVSIIPVFPTSWESEDELLSVFFLYMKDNPFWWHHKNKEITNPFVHFLLHNMEGKKVNMPVQVIIQSEVQVKHNTMRGVLDIHPYWTLNDYDIQVCRIRVPKGGKLVLEFMPMKDNMKIQVVVKKGERPELIDFWSDSTAIPEPLASDPHELSYSFYMDEVSESDNDYFYIGILPHIDTLHKLLETVPSELLFPRMVSYDEQEGKEVKIDVNWDNPLPMKLHEHSTNKTLGYEFAAYGARCSSWNEDSSDWESSCQVEQPTSFKTAYCKCQNVDMLSPSFEKLQGDLRIFKEVFFYLTYQDNHIILLLVIFLIFLFIGLIIWSVCMDGFDQEGKDVIFLVDNEPTDLYSYIIIVKTGRQLQAGTTSNVAIQLIGEMANSSVHILIDNKRLVLRRDSQDCFVLRTKAPLGDIFWINLWHDYTGSSPDWYCEKIIVHDIQNNEVWFFVTEQWLSPLYGDGTMSCSVYKTVEQNLLEKHNRFKECIKDEFYAGQHGWLSLFYLQSYNQFTRCQRLGVLFTHISIIMLLVMHTFDYPQHGKPIYQLSTGFQVWSWQILYNGFISAIIAFPINLILILCFICIAPSPNWSNSPHYDRGLLVIEIPRKDHSKAKLKRRNLSKGENIGSGDWQFYPVTHSNNLRPPAFIPHNNIAPIIGRQTEGKVYCFPYWVKYIMWVILFLIIIPCLFFTVLYGISYSLMVSYCFVSAFVIAILSSALLLETCKLILFGYLQSKFAQKELMIEDRSSLVWYLLDDNTVPMYLVPEVRDEIGELRKEQMYLPIPKDRADLLQRNEMKQVTYKSYVWEICIILVFIIILKNISNAIRDPISYYNVRNIELHLIESKAMSGKSTLDLITSQEEFLIYLSGTFTKNIYTAKDYNGEGITKDFTNYLVGSPRLRQIRVAESCNYALPAKQNSTSKCSIDYKIIVGDTTDYNPSWEPLDKIKPFNPAIASVWLYHTGLELGTTTIYGTMSTYSGGGYVVYLGRTTESSLNTLQYLKEREWFDSLTKAMIVEFTLYNPNRNLVSIVRLLAERTAAGGYVVKTNIDTVVVKSINCTTTIIIIVLFNILTIMLVLFLNWDSDSRLHKRPRKYLENIWFGIGILLAILWIALTLLYVQRYLLLITSIDKLANAHIEYFPNFSSLLFWDKILITVISFMLFFAILAIWHLLSVRYHFQLMSTTLCVSSYTILSYTLEFLIIIFAFMCTGHLLFVGSSYQFSSIINSLTSISGFVAKLFCFDFIVDTPHDSSMESRRMAQLFYVLAFILFIFIFRWGFSVIMIKKFRKVVNVARDKWQYPINKNFMQLNLNTVTMFECKGFSKDNADTSLDEYIRATPNISKARLQAMNRVVTEYRLGKKRGGQLQKGFISEAKVLAMSATVFDLIEGHLRHSAAKTGIWQDEEEQELGAEVRDFYERQRDANYIVSTYFQIVHLEKKIQDLNATLDTIYNLIKKI